MKDKRYISELPNTGFIRQAQLVPAIVPVSNSTFWRWIKAGEFPAPVKLSERVTVWQVEAVHQWLADKARSGASNAPGGGTGEA